MEPLIQGQPFLFSKESELAGPTQYWRILAVFLLFVLIVSMPTLLLLNQFGVYDVYEDIPLWTWLCYIFLFNSVVLLFLAKYSIRTIPFPFSNCYYKNNASRLTDRKFSQEFVTRIERMT